MFLFEYLIKLLLGNVDSLFSGLFIVLFGYYGWLLWSLNNNVRDFAGGWMEHRKCLKELKSKIDALDESVYHELVKKLNDSLVDMERFNYTLDNYNEEIQRYRQDIIEEIKESADDTKEIMKILFNNRSRSIGLNTCEKQRDSNLKEDKGLSRGTNKATEREQDEQKKEEDR